MGHDSFTPLSDPGHRPDAGSYEGRVQVDLVSGRNRIWQDGTDGAHAPYGGWAWDAVMVRRSQKRIDRSVVESV